MSQMSKYQPFTLLEMVLAMTVLAIVSGLTAAMIYAMPRTLEMQKIEAAKLDGLVQMERFADSAIRNLIPFAWSDRENAKKQIFQGDPQRISGAYRTSIQNADDTGLYFFAMGLRDGKVILQHRREPIHFRLEEPLPETLTEEILLEEVKELRFLYPDWVNGELKWKDDWDENKETGIPPVIGWIVTFESGQEVKFLRRTSGNAQYSTYGLGYGNKK